MLVETNGEMELGFKEVNNAGEIRSPLDEEGGPRKERRGLCRVHLTVWLNNERFLQMRLAQAPFPGLHFISGPICLQLRYYYQSNVDVM